MPYEKTNTLNTTKMSTDMQKSTARMPKPRNEQMFNLLLENKTYIRIWLNTHRNKAS